MKPLPVMPEAGYTPANLRVLIAHFGITQNQAAAFLGVNPRTMRMWLADRSQTDKYSDMPLAQWRRLLSYPTPPDQAA